MAKSDRWDVPKRDLLDIERTAQAEKVDAADALVDAAEALSTACRGADTEPLVQEWARIVLSCCTAYRVACGEDTRPGEPWTASEIMDREG